MAGKAVCGGLSALFMSSDNEEFQEEDVWSCLIPNTDSSSSELQKNPEEDVWSLIHNTDSSSSKLEKNPSAPACRHFIATPPIPKSAPASATPIVLQPEPPREASKPIDFPDWSKILKEEPKKTQCWDDDVEHDVNHDDDEEEDFTGRKSHRPHGVNDDDDYDLDNLLPHEYLDKKYKKNRMAYSMCEGGVGRTLKGYDMRNFRNKVLFMTGFIEKM